MKHEPQDWPIRVSDYEHRLAIIVPYRDRVEHLSEFLPHMESYFSRHKLDRHLRYSIHIVEQVEPGTFNRGRLRNAGFMVARDSADYFCFHDVDYLPIWSDYSYVARPTRLIWHGTVLNEDYDNFFGGVIAFNRADFERVNGYSNDYWGWGFEDTDLLRRCGHASLEVVSRDGTFQALEHDHHGHVKGGLNEEASRNATLFKAKGEDPEGHLRDGITTLTLQNVETRSDFKAEDGRRLEHVHHHFVRW